MALPAAAAKEWIKPKVSWGPIPSPRCHHFSFAEGNRLYIFGGKLKAKEDEDQIHYLNISTMTWDNLVTTGNGPTQDSRVASNCAYNAKKLYVLVPLLNQYGKMSSIDLFVLDLETLTWSTKRTAGALPPTLGETVTVFANGNIYTFGGVDLNGQYNNALHCLNLTTFTWLKETNYESPLARANVAACSYGNLILFFGGRTYSTAVPYPPPTVFCFDTVAKKWKDSKPRTISGNLPSGREGSNIVTWDKYLMIFSGYDTMRHPNDHMNDVYALDCTSPASMMTISPAWQTIRVSGTQFAASPRTASSSVVIGNTLYIFGGRRSWDVYYNDLHTLKLSSDKTLQELSDIDKFLESFDTPAATKTEDKDKPAAASATDAKPEEKPEEEKKPEDAKPAEEKKPENGTEPKKEEEEPKETKKVTFGADTKPEAEEVKKPPAPVLPLGFRERLAWAANNANAFPDVVFKLGDLQFYAHKCILSTRSVVFKKKWEPTPSSPSAKRKEGDDDDSVSQLDVSTESAASPKGMSKPRLSSPSSPKLPVKVITQLAPDGITELEVVEVSDDFDPDDFALVLTYIYNGLITIKNEDHAEIISSIAYEFLLDDLMKFCRQKQFPATLEEPVPQVSRSLRRMVGSSVGSDIFFVVKRKKLFAHRVILYIFSRYFKDLLDEKAARRYIEVKDLPGDDIVQSFIEYCRMMYCYFAAAPEHKEKQPDVAALLQLSLIFKEDRMVDLLATQQIISNESVAQIYSVATQHNLKNLRRSCVMYLLDNFGSIVKDKDVLSKWSPALLKDILSLYKSGTYNWLDILWFAAHTNNDTLKDEAAKNLEKLINLENVVQLMTGAHNCNAKTLRSKCLDFILQHTTNVEAVQRMQHFSDTKIAKVASLSTSVATEVEQKVANQVAQQAKTQTKSKICTLCSTEFSIFGANKKNSCALCKRLACNNCMHKNQVVPPVFGYGTKPKSICKQCIQMVAILQPTQQPAAAATSSKGQ